jgi:hypothetical protein
LRATSRFPADNRGCSRSYSGSYGSFRSSQHEAAG